MKLAVTGKGGVGKTTISASLATLFAQSGARVIAVDADPDSNLASTLGFPNPDGITPISEMSDLIAERTGGQPGTIGGAFTLNPKVDDIPDVFCPEHNGVRLVSMGGGSREGGSGCLCPENASLRALMGHVIFLTQDVVILDMVAGIEHLTRGTARGVDALIIVVEPGARSLETAGRIKRLAGELGIPQLLAVGNKVRDKEDRAFIQNALEGVEAAAFIPYSADVIHAGMGRDGVSQALDGEVGEQIRKLQASLEKRFPMPGR